VAEPKENDENEADTAGEQQPQQPLEHQVRSVKVEVIFNRQFGC